MLLTRSLFFRVCCTQKNNASFVCGYVKIHYVCVCEHLVAFSCFVRIFFFLSRESGSLTKILLHMNFTQIMGPVCV